MLGFGVHNLVGGLVAGDQPCALRGSQIATDQLSFLRSQLHQLYELGRVTRLNLSLTMSGHRRTSHFWTSVRELEPVAAFVPLAAFRFIRAVEQATCR
jgi:hypothetical protein